MLRYIRAMSEYNKNIRRKLSDTSLPMMEHLIKLMLYPESEYCPGWRNEVYKFVNKVDKRKLTNSYPDSNFVLKAFSVHYDILYNCCDQIKADMRYDGCMIVPADVTEHDIIDKVDEYCRWLAKRLSDHGKVTNEEVHAILKELGL